MIHLKKADVFTRNDVRFRFLLARCKVGALSFEVPGIVTFFRGLPRLEGGNGKRHVGQ